MSSELVVAIVTIVSPIAGLTGVLIGVRTTRRSNHDTDVWRHREETMRMLRWAAEQLASEELPARKVGLVTLSELMRSELLQPEDRRLVTEVFNTALADALGPAYSELENLDVEATLDEGGENGSTDDQGHP